jgi:hypothetical protein
LFESVRVSLPRHHYRPTTSSPSWSRINAATGGLLQARVSSLVALGRLLLATHQLLVFVAAADRVVVSGLRHLLRGLQGSSKMQQLRYIMNRTYKTHPPAVLPSAPLPFPTQSHRPSDLRQTLRSGVDLLEGRAAAVLLGGQMCGAASRLVLHRAGALQSTADGTPL